MSAALGLAVHARTSLGVLEASALGKNLFNINDPNVGFAQFVSDTTGVVASGTYTNNVTGYIPVEPSTAYKVNIAGRRAYFDKDRVYVSGVNDSSTTFTTPASCYYVRFTVPNAQWPYFQVELGSSATTMVPYAGRPFTELPNPYNIGALRQTHYRLMKRLLATPESVQCIITLAGDSYTHAASRWSGPFTDYMVAKFGDAGGGWCGFGFLPNAETKPFTGVNQPTYLNGNVRTATYGTRVYGQVTGTYYTEGSCDLASLTLTQSGDYIEQDIPATPVVSAITLHYKANGGTGSVRYSLDAGANWTTLSLAGTAGVTVIATLSLAHLTQAGKLTIEWVSGTCVLFGVNLKSAASGVRVNKTAATGSNVGGWAGVDATNFGISFADLGGNLTVYMDGPNNQASVTPSVWGSKIDILFGRFRAGLTTYAMDVLFMCPPENPRTNNAFLMQSYGALARAKAGVRQATAAGDGRFAYYDCQNDFGPPHAVSEYASTGAVPLFNVDNLHPEPTTGGRLLVYGALKCVLPLGIF